MKVYMNNIALEIASNTVLLTAVIQSAHLTDARGYSPGGIGQGPVAENFQSSVEVNGCGFTTTPLYVFIMCSSLSTAMYLSPCISLKHEHAWYTN
jgi:hypothetical protein